jgi:hypothetical protein
MLVIWQEHDMMNFPCCLRINYCSLDIKARVSNILEVFISIKCVLSLESRQKWWSLSNCRRYSYSPFCPNGHLPLTAICIIHAMWFLAICKHSYYYSSICPKRPFVIRPLLSWSLRCRFRPVRLYTCVHVFHNHISTFIHYFSILHMAARE